VVVGVASFAITRPPLIASTSVAAFGVCTFGIGTTLVGVGFALINITTSFAITLPSQFTRTSNARVGWRARSIRGATTILRNFSYAVITRVASLSVSGVTWFTSTRVTSRNVVTSGIGIALGRSVGTFVDVITSLSISGKSRLASTLDSRESGLAQSVWGTAAILRAHARAMISRSASLSISRITWFTSTRVTSRNVVASGVGIAHSGPVGTFVDVITSLSISRKSWLASTLDSRKSGFASGIGGATTILGNNGLTVISSPASLSVSGVTWFTGTRVTSRNIVTSGIGIAHSGPVGTLINIIASLSVTSEAWFTST
jgi:hypothetical protein